MNYQHFYYYVVFFACIAVSSVLSILVALGILDKSFIILSVFILAAGMMFLNLRHYIDNKKEVTDRKAKRVKEKEESSKDKDVYL